jgi:hypothetical protein
MGVAGPVGAFRVRFNTAIVLGKNGESETKAYCFAFFAFFLLKKL